MKTIKIGRSSSNNIVINDITVSAQHAIISILDTKEVKIKDLNSTNGTYVNGKRISGEVVITANDVIEVGNNTLDWIKNLNERKQKPQLPSVDDSSAIKQKKTIGRIAGNDIVINHSDVSTYHAQLIEKMNGEIVIVDSGSTNGTYVNGKKINLQILLAGDRVLIAKKYPLNWQSIFGNDKANPVKSNTINTKAMAMVSATLIVVVCVFIFKPWGGKTWSPEKIYATYNKSVVMIHGEYYYNVKVGDYNFGNYIISDNRLVEDRTNVYTGTGFFVSQDGKIVTNKHVAVPWAYEGQEKELIKKYFQEYLKNESRKSRAHQIEFLPLINEIKVTGHLRSIGIILNDNYVNSRNDIIPCHVLKSSDDNNIDVAVIQTNSATLPAGVATIVDLDKAVTSDSDIKAGGWICTIGFPAGFIVGQTTQGLKATNSEGKITQMREYYNFGHDLKIVGGASGSPVFNGSGHLIGIVNAGFLVTQSNNMAIKAKYAVELAK